MRDSDEILFEVADGVGRITLNRPRALNALTQGMCADMTEQLNVWASDDAVASVEVRGAGERAFCSGADVRSIRTRVLAGEPWLSFFEVEYTLNSLVARYPKPYVAFMSGIDMGGGLGLSAHGSRRVVDATSRLAMPETIIGFTPDVGMAWQLSHAPGELGTHVAVLATVQRPQLGQPAPGEAVMHAHAAGSGLLVERQRQMLEIGLIGMRAHPHELCRGQVEIIVAAQAGVVVADLVIVPGQDPRMRAVRGLQVRIELVVRVAAAELRQREGLA